MFKLPTQELAGTTAPAPITGVTRVMRIVNGVPTPVRIDRANYNPMVHVLAGEEAPRNDPTFMPPADDETRFLHVTAPAPAPTPPKEQLSAPTPAGHSTATGKGPAAPATEQPVSTAQAFAKEIPRTASKADDGKWYLFVGDVRSHPNGFENLADMLQIADLHGYIVTNRETVNENAGK